MSAPRACAASSRSRISSRLPARSPTTGLIWASARRMAPVYPCLRLVVENLAPATEFHHPQRNAVVAEDAPPLYGDAEVAPASCEQVCAVRRRVEPHLEDAKRRAEVGLPPGEVLPEGACREVAGSAKR